MLKRVFSVVMFILLVTSMLTMAFNIQPVRASGTIYIRVDGSIDPPDAPISTVDNTTYTLTGNITADADGIVVERSNIIIDGNGYTLQGSGTLNSNGINLTGRSNVTIQNIEIKTGFDYSIRLTNSHKNKIVGNNITNASTYGPRIYLEYSSDNSIIGNKMTNNGMGIELDSSCSNNSISGNDIINNGYGMALLSSSDNSISGNNITANGGYGILLQGASSGTNVSGNNITNNGGGILFDGSSDNSISGNNITANGGNGITTVTSGYGIYLGSSSNNNIFGNNITANIGYGLCLSGSSNNISGNTFIDDGLFCGSYQNSVENNTVNGRPLVYLESVSNYTVEDDAGQVILVRCENIRVEGLNLSRATAGVELWETSNSTISGNEITANYWYGINLHASSGNSIYGNDITANNWYGIWLDSSCNNIGGNNVTNNGYGIAFDSSSGNSIFHNNFINNTNQVYSTSDSVNVWDYGYPSGGNYWSDYNGTDLYRGLYQNETGSDGIGDIPYVIDANNADRYPLMNLWLPLPSSHKLVPLLDTFVTVMEPSTIGWDAGIGAPFVIYDADLYKMWYWAFDQPGGLGRRAIAYAESNDGITWFNNQVVHDAGSGDYVTGSPWVVKEGGTYRMWHADYFEVIAGDWSYYIAHMTSTDGISWPAFMSADDQKVLSAQGHDYPQGDGYDIWHACVIHESSGYVMWYTVFDHPQPGVRGPTKIWRATSTDGITWSNRQLSLPYIPDTWEGYTGHASVVKEDDGTYTMFYGGSPINGPYNFIGIAQSNDGISWVNRTQLLKPPDLSANMTAIQDPFHFTDVNGKRYLYFTYYDGKYKFGRIQLGTLPHDVAVTNITPSKTVVGQGYSMNITATATNQGDYTETFNVTAYANVTAIQTATVTLTSQNSTTLTFTWNTTGFAYGNYTLSAYAWPVSGETDTSNNQLVGGQVLVSIPGGINRDGIVDIYDAILLANAYNSTPGKANWNPDADINGDNIVDIYDAIVLANHYNQQYP